MAYNCSRCPRYFNSKEALSSHETGFHKISFFDSGGSETNMDSANESNESSPEDEPRTVRKRRTRANTNSRRKRHRRDSSSDASTDAGESSDDEPKTKREGRTKRSTDYSRKRHRRDSSSNTASDVEESDNDTESQPSGTSYDSDECSEVRRLHKPSRVDFWCKPLVEYQIRGIELMLKNEDLTNMCTKLMEHLELPQTREQKMMTFGEHVKDVIASIVEAANNGEMNVTRKILVAIVELSSDVPVAE
ncbi:hypothetical protein Fcan01_11445 [Folsomia candida]|uniref:C2H2-type domain-containing protein n=1 Tax=Folsomia candida TaxID=158441 RepID=A0A226EBU5_FOLCA|nr:hypothetical protein Fcan01_11446 [Folsomia candida]OXA55016.1 hypothetical protein Fcan01_11445 [Folsomia candida]